MKNPIQFFMMTSFLGIFTACAHSTSVTIKPYVGLKGGYTNTYSSLTATVVNTHPLTAGEVHQSIPVKPKGYGIGALVGLRFQKEKLFFATEAWFTTGNEKDERLSEEFLAFVGGVYRTVSLPLKFNISAKQTYAASFLLGHMLTDVVEVFVKLDLLATKFSVGYVNDNPAFSAKYDKWAFGLAPGIGIQGAITKNISLRFDYSHRFYNSIKTNNLANGSNFLFTENVKAQVTPRSHSLMLSLIYGF